MFQEVPDEEAQTQLLSLPRMNKRVNQRDSSFDEKFHQQANFPLTLVSESGNSVQLDNFQM